MANAYFTTGSSSSVTGLDLNNDGIDDIVQSNAVDDAGRVTVIYGSTQGFDPTIDLSNIDPLDGFALTGTAVGDEFGYVLGTANDLLDNGEDALLIGSRAKGQVDVVFAGQTSIGFTVTGLPTLADGMSVAGLGDFNGDGIGDFAIGAPEAGDGLTFPGEVYVIFGSTTLSGTTLDVSALDGTNGFVINGFQQDAQAGASIAGAGDLNGDGFADLVIGAPTFDDFSNTNSGTAFIVYGSDGTIAAAENIDTSTNLSTTPLIGFAAGDEGGRSVGGGADVNGDNIPDVIVAAPLADPNGSSAGIAYVLFDPDPATAITLPDVDGSDGFVIEGLNANDQLGAAVGLLGDVSGDGIGDIGVLTRSGDLYIIYGTTANTGGSVDLSLIDQVGGPDGIVFTNLFDGDANTQVSLTSLGDINADQSGSINDISISAIGQGGTPLAAISILGGEANFAAMQAAAGSTGGTIDFSALPDDVDFVANDTTITIGGDTAATVTEDSPNTTGTLTVTNTGSGATPVFANDTVQGALGLFVIANNVWTYTVDGPTTTTLQALDAGDQVFDRAIFTADDGTKQEVNITINGLDDAATLTAGSTLSVFGNIGETVGALTLTDVDEDDSPTIPAAEVQGVFGKITVAADGSYTYIITNPDVTTLTGSATFTDTINLTASDGSTQPITVTIGAPLDPLDFDDNPNRIITSFADDTINAFGGDDFINAGGGDDTVNAGTGNDTITDAFGDDTVNAGADNDTILLLSGNNIVNGEDGNDFITTGFGSDIVNGGAGDDVIKADGDGGFLFGNNEITGGADDDIMMGGAGVDTFIFNTNDGVDQIGLITNVTETATGFDATVSGAAFQAGIDKIQLAGFDAATQTAITDALSGSVNAILFADGSDTVFVAEGTSITLTGVDISTLQESDFIFV